MLVGQHIMLAALPIMGICLVAGFIVVCRPGRPEADAGRDEA